MFTFLTFARFLCACPPPSTVNILELIVDRLEFGYLFDGTNAYIQYYINREPQNDWFDCVVKEVRNKSNKNRLNETINRIVRRVLKEHTLKAVRTL